MARRDSTPSERLNDIKRGYLPGTTRDANDIRTAVLADVKRKAKKK